MYRSISPATALLPRFSPVGTIPKRKRFSLGSASACTSTGCLRCFLRLSGLHRLRVQRMLRHEKPFRMGRSVMAEGENVVVPCGCPDFGEIPLDPVVVVAACKQTVFLCIDRRHVILVFCPVHVPDLDAVRGVQCTSYRYCLSSMRVSFFIFPLYRAFRPSHSRTAHAHTMLRSRRSVP